ncbi:MAG: class I tRNA ligase family protein, partial [Eggerthellaceae bacterium]|nr:class I tRNA ligase family protein [Eggerthellaceae bacterium]
VMAPILTFTTDEVWEHYPTAIRNREGRPENVQLAGWPELSDFMPNLPTTAREEFEAFKEVLALRETVTKALEDARNAGEIVKSQEADVAITLPTEELAKVAGYAPEVFEELFIVASVTFAEGEAAVVVTKSAHEKCPRCWNYRSLGANANHPAVCQRCGDVLDSLGFVEE